jgi:hypothetical protein
MAKTRKAARKASHKASRKSHKASHKASRKSHKASHKGGKKTRKMTPWLQKVMKVYREMKAKDPKTRLGDAMKAAKRM